MKKLFVSVPMRGRTETEIRDSISKMKQIAEIFEGEELELIDSYVANNPPKNGNQAIWYLGEALKKLSEADVFIGINEAWDWNGCHVENQVANAYGVKSYSVCAKNVIPNYIDLIEKSSLPTI